jgi:hypothetical protein
MLHRLAIVAIMIMIMIIDISIDISIDIIITRRDLDHRVWLHTQRLAYTADIEPNQERKGEGRREMA